MKYKIYKVDVSKRALNSALYTLTRRENLTLCKICFLPYADEKDIHPDDQAWETYGIEFWAADVSTAYDELITTLQTFHNCGLTDFDSTDRPFESEKVLAWLDHYDALSGLVLIDGESKLDHIHAVLDFDRHVTYVLRKLCETISEIKDQIGKDEYYNLIEGNGP